MPTNLTIFIYFFLYLPKSFGGALIVIKTKPPIPFDISFSSTYYKQIFFIFILNECLAFFRFSAHCVWWWLQTFTTFFLFCHLKRLRIPTESRTSILGETRGSVPTLVRKKNLEYKGGKNDKSALGLINFIDM